MIDRSEWDDAADAFLARERERLGPPPTAAELAAYARGELTEEETARIRALLVVHPEAADMLTADVDGADVLSDDEVARDWASLQKLIATEAAPPAPLRPSFTKRAIPIAATIAFVAMGALLAYSRLTIRRLADAPRIHGVRHELLPAEEERGPAAQRPYRLPAGETDYLLALLLYDEVRGELRLDLVDTRTGKTAWSGRTTAQQPSRTIELSVPRRFLDAAATYRVNVYAGGTATPAASYLVRVDR